LEKDIDQFYSPNWKASERATVNDEINVHVVLKHAPERVSLLEEKLMDVSDPRSPDYGKHLSIQEVKDVLSLSPHVSYEVEQEISKYNITDINMNKYGDILSLQMNAKEAEKLFHTELYHHVHKNAPANIDSGVIRAIKPYHVPSTIADHVAIVEGLVRFPKREFVPTTIGENYRPKAFEGLGADDEFSSCGSSCTGYTTPAVLQKRYGYPTIGESDVADGNRMAVAEFQFQYYDDADMGAFSDACGLESPVEVASTVGGNKPSFCGVGVQACIESLLDIEYIKAVAGAIPLEVYYSGTFSLYDWAVQVNDDDSPAQVQSVSYGNDEIQQTSDDYMFTTNTEFMKAGARGVSIFFASGDQGVWGRSGSSTGQFNPDFPGGSPYVTAVGGTDFEVKSTIGDETTWADSGGGFSNTFDIPDYQADAVATYKSTATLPDASYFNNTGRGYPDISALGGQVNPYCIAYGGSGKKFTGVAGTSASSPVAAGIFAVLNNVRLSSGGAALGFLNPFLYQNADAFNDVTTGTNDAGNRKGGFDAAKGWDPATGLGTPDYTKLAQAL
jgi:tripeptidyl-peptidase-1